MENIKYFNYLVKVTEIMQDVHLNLNPGLPWQKQHLTRRQRTYFTRWLD